MSLGLSLLSKVEGIQLENRLEEAQIGTPLPASPEFRATLLIGSQKLGHAFKCVALAVSDTRLRNKGIKRKGIKRRPLFRYEQ